VAGKLPPSVDATSLVLGGHADSPVTTFVRGALAEATHYVFVGLLVVAAVSVVALLLMPRKAEQLEF
jgi:hypothetical protein